MVDAAVLAPAHPTRLPTASASRRIQASVITYAPMATATATTPAKDSAAPVGPRIRALRDAMGLSLRDLAERSGVSAPMLSQVERGETSPTLAVAGKIAAGLELTLSQLLRLDEGQHGVLSRAADRRRSELGGHRFEELTPPLPGQRADVSLHVLEPGATTGGREDPPMHEPGRPETAGVPARTLVLIGDGARPPARPPRAPARGATGAPASPRSSSPAPWC